jgi:hypothetical protein
LDFASRVCSFVAAIFTFIWRILKLEAKN